MRVTAWLGRRPRVVAAVGAAAVVLGAGVPLLVVQPWHAAASRPADPIRGPRPVAVFITPTGGGARMRCPQGAEPTLDISGASFAPRLRAGTDFARGRYRVVLTGRVVNETTGAIVVERVVPWALHRGWPAAAVRAPVRLAPNSSGRLVIRGTVRVSGRVPAAVGASLHWHWADPRLAACRGRGLIGDD